MLSTSREDHTSTLSLITACLGVVFFHLGCVLAAMVVPYWRGHP